MPSQAAFEKLKELLITPPILAFPNFELPFILETDASGMGLGAVLSQQQGSGPTSGMPIAYASRTLQKHERNYGISRAGGKGTAGTAMAVPVFEGEKMASLEF